MKRRYIAVLVGLGILILMISGTYIWLRTQAQRQLEAMVYETIHMDRIQDGIYIGETDAGLVYVKVEVVIKDRKIEDIQILAHRNGMGEKAESIILKMLEENSYDVEAVSGATMSSEALKSAVGKGLKASMTE